jgi:hypothetical protein
MAVGLWFAGFDWHLRQADEWGQLRSNRMPREPSGTGIPANLCGANRWLDKIGHRSDFHEESTSAQRGCRQVGHG